MGDDSSACLWDYLADLVAEGRLRENVITIRDNRVNIVDIGLKDDIPSQLRTAMSPIALFVMCVIGDYKNFKDNNSVLSSYRVADSYGIQCGEFYDVTWLTRYSRYNDVYYQCKWTVPRYGDLIQDITIINEDDDEFDVPVNISIKVGNKTILSSPHWGGKGIKFPKYLNLMSVGGNIVIYMTLGMSCPVPKKMKILVNWVFLNPEEHTVLPTCGLWV